MAWCLSKKKDESVTPNWISLPPLLHKLNDKNNIELPLVNVPDLWWKMLPIVDDRETKAYGG